MSCFICGRSACAPWMHSIEEQKKYERAIDAFEKAVDIRNEIRNHIDEDEDEE